MIFVGYLLFSSMLPSLAFYLDVYLTPLESDPNDFVFKRIEIGNIEDVDNTVEIFCRYNNVSPAFCSEIKVQAFKSAHMYAPSKRSVNSFDIFDTILARDVLHPNDIFSLVEDGFPYRNFKSWREQAANMANGTFGDIYSHFGRLSGEQDGAVIAALQRFEVACERNHTYLMEQNYRVVRDGDVLVTDSHLPLDAIAALLKQAGFNKTTNLYVSSSGKSQGWMFRQLLGMYRIRQHLGADLHSDVQQARQHGISSELSAAHLLSPAEKILASAAPVAGVALALLLRRFRHRNPHPPGSPQSALFLDQAQFNIPLLLLVSYEIREIMHREGLTRLLLTSRQGCLLEKLFPALFPREDIDTVRLAASRRAYSHPSPAYEEYLRRVYLPGRTLIFDLHGTFAAGLPLFRRLFRADPRVHLFVHRSSADADDLEHFPGLSFSVHTEALAHLEDLNADVVGPLISVYSDAEGQLREFRGPLGSYAAEEALVYRDAVELFVATADCQQAAALVRRIALEAAATGVDEVCGGFEGGGRAALSPLTPALLLSDTLREVLLRMVPCPGDVRGLAGALVHSSLSVWMAEFQWPWSQHVSPERLEWELRPWFDRPAQLLFIDRSRAGAGASGDPGAAAREDGEVAASSAQHAVFALYLGRRYASVFTLHQSCSPSPSPSPSHRSETETETETERSYSLFRFPSQQQQQQQDSFLQRLDLQAVAGEMQTERFDFIFESNIPGPCLLHSDEGQGPGPGSGDDAAATILELLHRQIAALRDEQGGGGDPDPDLFPPLRSGSGSSSSSSGGWLYAMHFDRRLCGLQDPSPLQSYYSRRLWGRLDAAGGLLTSYWIGDVLVFRAAPNSP